MNAVLKAIHCTLGSGTLSLLCKCPRTPWCFFLTDGAFDNDDLGSKHRATFALLVATYAASGVTRG